MQGLRRDPWTGGCNDMKIAHLGRTKARLKLGDKPAVSTRPSGVCFRIASILYIVQHGTFASKHSGSG